MKLKKLQLHNFRCFEDVDLTFDDKLTVIVGENGAGKTTILESAAIAVGTLLNSFDKVANYGIKKMDAHNKYFKMGSVIDVQPQFPVEITAKGEVDGQLIEWKRTLTSENGKTTIVDAKSMTRISEEYQNRMMQGDTKLIMPIIAYYGTGRLWDYHREKKIDTFKKNNRSNGYIDCLDGRANVKLMLNWFKKMSMKEQNGTVSPELAAVRKAMEHCFSLMTNIDKDVEVQFNPDTTEIEVAYCDRNEENVKLALSQLSDGYKGMLSLIADIAYRMAILNPFLSDNVLTDAEGIILIDEVDLHLHPAWQQRVIEDLTTIFPKVQFIVSTHAPAVINSVKSNNLVIIRNLQPLQPESQVYGKDVKSVLNELMGVEERPQKVADLFTEFYKDIDTKKYDHAEQVLNLIDELRGYHDQEVAGCRVKLKLERLRGGEA